MQVYMIYVDILPQHGYLGAFKDLNQTGLTNRRQVVTSIVSAGVGQPLLLLRILISS